MRKLRYAAIFTCLLPLPCEASEWDSITLDCKLTAVSMLNDDKGHLTPVQPTEPRWIQQLMAKRESINLLLGQTTGRTS